MTQADSRLKFYHFGWRSDINKNIDNNFDPGNSTGRLFPALHFDIPDYFEPTHEENYLGFNEDIAINLYFDDLQAYENDGSQTIKTLIEKWGDLKQISEDFVSNLTQVLEFYNIGFVRTQPRYEPKANLFNDNLITFQVSFVLSHVAPCTLEENKIVLSSLPEVINTKDLENNLNFV